MEFSAALSKPTKTEWSELRLTKCAQQAASLLSTKAMGLCRQLEPAAPRGGRFTFYRYPRRSSASSAARRRIASGRRERTNAVTAG